MDLTVELRVDSSSASNNFLHTFVVNNWNAVVLQMRTLPSVPREVELVAKGNGSAVAKVTKEFIFLLFEVFSFVRCFLHTFTMVENRKKHRQKSHPIIHCPTSEAVSERVNE